MNNWNDTKELFLNKMISPLVSRYGKLISTSLTRKHIRITHMLGSIVIVDHNELYHIILHVNESLVGAQLPQEQYADIVIKLE